jgi:hypothetical protein
MSAIIPLDRAIIQRVDATLVRAFLDALPDAPPDGRAIARVRACLASLQDPDVRYLVACLVGPDAPDVARVMTAVLEAAGAPTGTVGATTTTLSGAPMDEALFSAAGTHAASAVYTVHETRPDLGEVGRREASVLLGLVALAEGGARAGLLLDEDVVPGDPVHAPSPDVVVIAGVGASDIVAAAELAPEGRTVIAMAPGDDARAAIEQWEKRPDRRLLLGGRDHALRRDAGGHCTFTVRGDPYVSFAPVDGIDDAEMSCALAACLAVGALGIRMREDWFVAGLDALRARDHVAT